MNIGDLISPIAERIHLHYKKKNIAIDWALSDIYLVSYPKSGTTWVCLILANILNMLRNEKRRVDFFSVHDFVPDIHANPEWIPNVISPRIIKSHESFKEWYRRIFIKGRGKNFPRVIYLIRDGRNCMSSYYRYIQALNGYDKSFHDFMEDRKIKRGFWHEHVKGWVLQNDILDNRERLVVKYEDMRQDPTTEVIKMLDFIGLETGIEMVRHSIDFAQLENIKILEGKYGGGVRYTDPDFRFAGKGSIESHENISDENLLHYFNENQAIFNALGYK